MVIYLNAKPWQLSCRREASKAKWVWRRSPHQGALRPYHSHWDSRRYPRRGASPPLWFSISGCAHKLTSSSSSIAPPIWAIPFPPTILHSPGPSPIPYAASTLTWTNSDPPLSPELSFRHNRTEVPTKTRTLASESDQKLVLETRSEASPPYSVVSDKIRYDKKRSWFLN